MKRQPNHRTSASARARHAALGAALIGSLASPAAALTTSRAADDNTSLQADAQGLGWWGDVRHLDPLDGPNKQTTLWERLLRLSPEPAQAKSTSTPAKATATPHARATPTGGRRLQFFNVFQEEDEALAPATPPF
eukprot:scaffold271275_cov17-Tisochrysis_lutea.AAC.1